MPSVVALAIGGALTGGIAAGSVAGGLTWGAGALIGAGVGAGAGMLFRKMGGKVGITFPGQKGITEVPKTTVEEIEAQEEGWAELTKRARGRRATILTEPQLAQMTPYTQRATLLAG